jgi:hypothetical protein
MAYFDIAQMSADLDLTSRVAACAAQENIPDPRGWAADNMLTIAASPGWGDAWASAIAGGNESPGRDAAVITDAQILSAVQATLMG